MFLKSNLDFVILFVTSRCNFKCKTCFYWESLNTTRDLTLDKFEIISGRLPSFRHLLISGGEPFLRSDLADVVGIFARQNNLEHVGIPTNAFETHRIISIVQAMLTQNPLVQFEIICSLDGLGATHDAIRGMENSFDHLVNTLTELKRLRQFSNLRLAVNSVINNQNVAEVRELIDFVKGLDVDIHHLSLLRDGHPAGLGLPGAEVLDRINDLRYETRKFYNRKSAPLKRVVANRIYRNVIANQERVLRQGKWNVGCVAGDGMLVIETNGDVRICETNAPIGNLLSLELDQILDLPQAREQLAKKNQHQCDCIHTCFISQSLEANIRKGNLWKALMSS